MQLTKQYFEEYLNKTLDEKLDPIKKDVTVLKQDVGVLKDDVTILKQDVGVLQEDVSSLKVKVNSISIDLGDMKETIDRIDQRDREDSDAFARIMVSHDNRLNRIERKLKIPVSKSA